MIFLPTTDVAKAVLTKVIAESALAIKPWPADAAAPEWVQFNGNALDELFDWLTPRIAQKVDFVDQQTENARKLFKQINSSDYDTYKKMFDFISPYLVKSVRHPFPKLSARKAADALHGFEREDPAEQPVGFEVSEANLTILGTVTTTNLVNVQVIFNDADKAYAEVYQFQVPATFRPVHFKPMLTKYLSDVKFTYRQGKECLAAYIAEANARQRESQDDENAGATDRTD